MSLSPQELIKSIDSYLNNTYLNDVPKEKQCIGKTVVSNSTSKNLNAQSLTIFGTDGHIYTVIAAQIV